MQYFLAAAFFFLFGTPIPDNDPTGLQLNGNVKRSPGRFAAHRDSWPGR